MQPSAEPVESEQRAQHLVLTNNAAFVARFVVQRLEGDRVISQTADFGRLATGQSRSVDLSTLRFQDQPLQVGDRVRLRVGAAAGVRRDGPSVPYAPSGLSAQFEVHGTTLAFSVRQV